jgi:hypothetical protein
MAADSWKRSRFEEQRQNGAINNAAPQSRPAYAHHGHSTGWNNCAAVPSTQASSSGLKK